MGHSTLEDTIAAAARKLDLMAAQTAQKIRQAGRRPTVDPNETLSRLRALAAEILATADRSTDGDDPEGVAMAELFQALDEWIERGGFLPAPWLEAITS